MDNITLDTIETFFNTPGSKVDTITHNVSERPSLKTETASVLIEGYTVKINRSGGAVYKDNLIVASIGRLQELVVSPDHRGKGIASALIVKWATSNLWYLPTSRTARTVGGDAAYKKAWQTLKPIYEARLAEHASK